MTAIKRRCKYYDTCKPADSTQPHAQVEVEIIAELIGS